MSKANDLLRLLEAEPEKTSDMFGNFMQQQVVNLFNIRPDQIERNTTENSETIRIKYPEGTVILSKTWNEAINTLTISVDGKAPENINTMVEKLAEFTRKFGWLFKNNVEVK